MHTHLRRQRNVVIDRCEFNMRMLEPGESVDDFICALKEIASCCDFCPNCTDDRFRDHLVVGTSDDEARRRMLELPDLTFQMAADLCRASESARLNSSAIRGPGEPSLRRLSEYRRQRGRPSGADSRSADQTRRRRLDCVGTCALTLQLGDVIQTVQVSVLRALHSPLLSWHDCIGLGILPRRADFDKLKAEFPRVFDTESTLRKMTGEPMKIELTDDAVPHAVTTARNIPFCWREDVRLQLDELMEKDIIEPVEHPTDWCHLIVPVAKGSSDGTVSGCRLTVDFTKLNRFVKRPTYPVRSPQDALAFVSPGAAYFTKLDSKAGYHQVPIRPEDRDET
ncbi:uncharacterized protein LOC122371521 [Amphibalanus amphitrite]|uniref:uncharacterized protein LOC122371521 n=1 Tax=Amphibalanus amphitrite TaxID=1232801 RepID=UPI001C900C9B|nr:uncharacterized protein LOC122371521 [Amphibalanus amphitrite]